MQHVDNTQPWEHPEIKLGNSAQYIAGWFITVGLMGIALLMVTTHALAPTDLLASISIIAFVTMMAKLILQFHLDFSETQRWNSLTLILNVPLLILSVGLTWWMFQKLYDQVMVH